MLQEGITYMPLKMMIYIILKMELSKVIKKKKTNAYVGNYEHVLF